MKTEGYRNIVLPVALCSCGTWSFVLTKERGLSFYVLLAVHLGITLATDQLNAHILVL
jgi:hypothetical protein